MTHIELLAQRWKDATINHFGLTEKQWQRYYAALKEANAVVVMYDAADTYPINEAQDVD